MGAVALLVVGTGGFASGEDSEAKRPELRKYTDADLATYAAKRKKDGRQVAPSPTEPLPTALSPAPAPPRVAPQAALRVVIEDVLGSLSAADKDKAERIAERIADFYGARSPATYEFDSATSSTRPQPIVFPQLHRQAPQDSSRHERRGERAVRPSRQTCRAAAGGRCRDLGHENSPVGRLRLPGTRWGGLRGPWRRPATLAAGCQPSWWRAKGVE